MARRGRKRNLERERLYWDLLASGLGTVQACRQVGIDRRQPTSLAHHAESDGARGHAAHSLSARSRANCRSTTTDGLARYRLDHSRRAGAPL